MNIYRITGKDCYDRYVNALIEAGSKEEAISFFKEQNKYWESITELGNAFNYRKLSSYVEKQRRNKVIEFNESQTDFIDHIVSIINNK